MNQEWEYYCLLLVLSNKTTFTIAEEHTLYNLKSKSWCAVGFFFRFWKVEDELVFKVSFRIPFEVAFVTSLIDVILVSQCDDDNKTKFSPVLN